MIKRYIILVLALVSVHLSMLQAQIIDEQGQYVDTLFHDHINRQAEDFVKASLVVAEPGGALYSIFGHACLHLVCDTFGLDYIFSYESENAASKLGKFLAGNLNMGLMAVPFDEYLADYAKEGRSVTEYPLLLPPSAKQELWRILDDYVNQGIYLPYDYSARGCAITCVNFVNMAIAPDSITYAPWTDKQMRTRREMGYDYSTKDFPWNMWFLMTMVGPEVDNELPPEEKLIIPSELAQAWSTATFKGKALLGEAQEVLPSTHEPYKAGFTPVMAAILLLVLVILGWVFRFDYADYVVLVICTLLGVLISYLVIFSTLPCTAWNWLIIPFNLLPAIAWKWRKYWGVYYAGVIGVWLVVMLILPNRQVDPANILLAITLAVVLVKQWLLENRILTKKN